MINIHVRQNSATLCVWRTHAELCHASSYYYYYFMPRYSVPEDIEITNKENKNKL